MNALPTLDQSVAVSYRRVSSVEQERASGLDRQRKAISRYAAANGLTVAADHAEDVSGKVALRDRAGLSAALRSCLELGAGSLLVEDRSRLARDEWAAHDAVRTFEAAGVRVLYADGSNGRADAAGHLADSIGHALVAYDRRVIVARMAAGRALKAERHPRARKQGGRLPHGYRRVRDGIEVDEQAAAEVRLAFKLVREGKSLQATADALTQATGRRWLPTTIARMLSRRDYTHKIGDERPIVSRRIWREAHAALAARRKRAA
jgi:DNA invertase Pin-like site-specific DNA recombinase